MEERIDEAAAIFHPDEPHIGDDMYAVPEIEDKNDNETTSTTKVSPKPRRQKPESPKLMKLNNFEQREKKFDEGYDSLLPPPPLSVPVVMKSMITRITMKSNFRRRYHRSKGRNARSNSTDERCRCWRRTR